MTASKGTPNTGTRPSVVASRERLAYIKAWVAKNPGKRAQAARRWYVKNRARVYARQKELRRLRALSKKPKRTPEERRERKREKAKARRERKREQVNAVKRAWYARNRETILSGLQLKRWENSPKRNKPPKPEKGKRAYTRENPDLETQHEWSYLNDYYKPAPGGLTDTCAKKAAVLEAILAGKKAPEPAPEKPPVVIRRRSTVLG